MTTDVTHAEWRSDDEDNIFFHHEGSVEILSDLDDEVEELQDEYYEMMNHQALNGTSHSDGSQVHKRIRS